MSFRRAVRSESGQMMEAFVASVILAIVMIGMAEIMLKHTEVTVKLKKFDQSKHLADMVFEQYNSWNNSQLILSKNVANVPAGGFFIAPGNLSEMGFHGLTLTTRANCPNSSTACTVTVQVHSMAGTRAYTRSYTTQMATDHAGATVDVWVLDPACSPVRPETFHSCGSWKQRGGFLVTASSSAISGFTNLLGTQEPVAYTQQDGHAILRNVATGTPVRITARLAGSAVFDTSPNPAQGYYVAGSTGSTASQIFNAGFSRYATNIVVFQNLLPLGRILGTLSNASGGPVDNMMVVLQSTASTGYGLQYNQTWNVLTDATGHYVFNNVLPGAFTIFAAGDPGSEVVIRPGDPLYRPGYSNHLPFRGSLAVPSTANSPTAYSVPTLPLQKLGSLHVAVSPSWSPGVPNSVTFSTRLPATLFRHSVLLETTAPADFYNVFDQSGSVLTFSGISTNTLTGAVVGYFANLEATGFSAGMENTVTLRPQFTYNLVAPLVSASGTSLGSVSVPIAPELDGPTTFQYLLQLTTVPHTLTAVGSVRDALSNAPIAGVTLYDQASPAHSAVSSGSGNFALGMTDPHGVYSTLVTFTCTPVPNVVGPAGTCTPANPSHTIVVNSNYLQTWIRASTDQYYQLATFFNYATPPTISMALQFYGLTGTVVDATTAPPQPLAGIYVCDKSWQLDLTKSGPYAQQPNPPRNGQCVKTDGAGNFSFLVNGGSGVWPISVSDRYVDNFGNRNAGYVQAYVPNNQWAANGKVYAGGDSVQVPVPYTASTGGVLGPITIPLLPGPGSI